MTLNRIYLDDQEVINKMRELEVRHVTYKGRTIELGELPGAGKAYWALVEPNRMIEHEVECGSWEDLERIAYREVDRLLDPRNT